MAEKKASAESSFDRLQQLVQHAGETIRQLREDKSKLEKRIETLEVDCSDRSEAEEQFAAQQEELAERVDGLVEELEQLLALTED